jgi:Xaa-Pro aminopeptidase
VKTRIIFDPMRYQKLPASLYVRNRKAFMAEMKPNAIAVFFSNDIYPTSADGTLPFKQASDLFWLTGVDQEETVLVLFPDAQNPAEREILFTVETNEHIAIWEGAKLDKANGRLETGVQNIQWTCDFDRTFHRLMAEPSTLYLNDNPHARARNTVETRQVRENARLRAEYPNYQIERSAPALFGLRALKSPEEIEQMQRACDITRAAFERVLRFVKPGVLEYEIEAELMHEFLRRGSRGFAYTPIIGSGRNACVLHYIENSMACRAGEVILMDVGAEYGNYAADMTRCVPVSGQFTDRQRNVYNAVLRVMKAATELLRPGVSLHEYHVEVGELMTKELLDLGLITAKDVADQDPSRPAYKKYFMHGTSHFIGLDVHDVGHWHKPIEAGHVFTVEPGIYILEENLGIRLENDVLITADGQLDLMAEIPIEAEAIEDAMNA